MQQNLMNKPQLIFILIFVVIGRLAYADAAVNLNNFLTDLRNLHADFYQTEYDEQHHEVRQSQGTFYLQRPGKFRWEYQNPYMQTIISDGTNVWFYDHDLAQVTVKPYNNALTNSPALLLSTNAKLSDNFQIIEKDMRDNLNWIELRPQKPEAGFSKIEIGLMGKDLLAMELLDNFNQLTKLKFSNLQRNMSLTPNIFQFIPPPDVDILGKPAKQ